MVKHVILWKLDDKLSESEKEQVRSNAKRELEGLVGKIPGLLSMQITVERLESSNADMMLDSTLESAEALKVYKDHPEHLRVANNYVRPYTVQRLCLDFNL
ncbi:MAG: Dabb family protein [Clostridia bacterium]|nr:Dabb family protein [Clostridia bacterium]